MGGDLPVDDVRDAIVKDGVWEHDFGVVDVRAPVWQDGECQISALESWNGDIAERRREDDIVGNDMVGKDVLESLHVYGLQDGADVGEGVVGWNKDGVV